MKKNTPPQIKAIFCHDTAPGLHSGEGWTLDSVRRDIATIHRLTSAAFSCSLDGAVEFSGHGFIAHVIVMRGGNLGVAQCGHRRVLGRGDIFVASAWLPLALDASDDLDVVVVTLPGWWAMQRMMDGFQILPHLFVPGDYFAAPLIADLAQRLFVLSSDDNAVAGQGLTMLADLMRTSLAACMETGKLMPRAQGRMGAIMWFVARHLEKPGLSAQDAAANLKCSVRTIYKACAAYGTTFNAMVMETRLVSAQYQLMRSDERVSEIAYGVGFASLSHFSRQFRARFGVPPKDMRQVKVAHALN